MKTLREIRREHIRKVLQENGWDMEKASEVLQIPEDRLKKEAKKLAKPPGELNAKGPRSPGQRKKEG
jgi:hypothetical protein